MSQVTNNYKVCDHCGGAIPAGASCLTGINGVLVLGGEQWGFSNLDFCCTAHVEAWLASRPTVPTPTPLYSSPPLD